MRGSEEFIDLFLKPNLQGGEKQLWWGGRVGVVGRSLNRMLCVLKQGQF